MAQEYSRPEGPTVTSDLPPSVHILLKKTVAKNHIVIGEDEAQIAFLEQILSIDARGCKRTPADRVTDEMLAGFEGKLFHVTMKHQVDLSPELRSRTGIWSADPIVKGSAAINTLVRHATTFLPGMEKIKREVLDRVGDELTRTPIRNIRAAIWQAAWMLSGPMDPWVKWKEPWDSPIEWLSYGMNVEMRLHALYKKLVRYASLTVYGADAAAKAGSSPSQQQYFKTLTLDPAKVYRSISLLSQFRQGRVQPYICAARIAVIWS